jgi:ADP-heptose:LPS heptosyltransferase
MKPPEVVILRALGLGDLLAAVPSLRALAAAFEGGGRCVLVTTPGVAPLAQWLGVAEVEVTAPLASLDSSLCDAAWAVNLHGRGPESDWVLLASGARRLSAFGNSPAAVDGPDWHAGEHEVQRWCRMLNEWGIPADPSQLDVEPPDVVNPVGRRAHDYTVVHPGAGSAARRWPPSRWAAVAAAEAADGKQVVLTGSPGEVGVAQRVAVSAGLPATAVLAGRTDVLGLAAVVASAGRVFSADTGVAHLATAFGVPSVVLFGPVPPDEWGPPPDRPLHRAVWKGERGERGEWRDPHARVVDPGLLDITVEDVLAARA